MDPDEFGHDEKVRIALGETHTVAGLPRLAYVDGPNGVRGTTGATAFPSSLVLAASFDRDLARRYGAAVAGEVLAAGGNALLGPGLDILRVPWAGRAAESLGEDPVVAGELGGAIVGGVHSRGVLSIAKHFVANNFEWLRTGTGSVMHRGEAIDVRVGARALHELYLAPFRRAVIEHGLRGLLASYNRLNGEYVAHNADILGIPREQWGYTGLFVPDFMLAVRDPERALAAGLDVPGLGIPEGRTAEMVEALPAAELDAIVERIVDTIRAVGMPHPADPDPAALGLPGTLDLAEEIAVQGAVLLRNDDVLPLAPGAKVALIAPADLRHLLVTGGSAGVDLVPERLPDLAAELGARGLVVEHVDAAAGDIPLDALGADDVVGGVIDVQVRSADGEETSHRLEQLTFTDAPGPDWSAVVDLELVAGSSGLHRLAVTFAGEVVVRLGGGAPVRGFREASPMIAGPEYPLQLAVETREGESVALRLEYRAGPALDLPPELFRPGFRVGWHPVSAAFARAAEAAARADVAVVVVGRVAGEAMDVDALTLPEPQDRLIRAIAAVNPRVVVAVAGTGPVVLPWRDEVPGILHVGNPGEGAGSALARLLTGEAEPGGRLPFTMPATEGSVPLSRSQYPGVGTTVDYSEGLAVGYRGYGDPSAIAFPFGHGLGYARFAWAEGGSVGLGPEGDVVVTARVHNLASRAGKLVPQLYVTPPDSSTPRGLVDFTTVEVEAGASAEFEFVVPRDRVARFDEQAGEWIVDAGSYRFELGESSAHVAVSGTVELR